MTPDEAKREVEWWSKEHNRDAVRAFANGGKVQFFNYGKWLDQPAPNFNRDVDWRPLPLPILRPYTDEELRGMVGKVFVNPQNGDVHLADHTRGVEIYLPAWGYFEGKDLLKDATHIDGSPCGVME